MQARPPKKKILKWSAQPLSTQEGEIGLVKLTDYHAFISDADGTIAERLFDSNVRGYWPHSQINKSIAETLKHPKDNAEFWLLNNGVTILTEHTAATAGFLEVEIVDPQIVNGLQTSRQIHGHFTVVAPTSTDGRRLLVRVIKTEDKTVRDSVIRATNSQNKMPEEALRATDAIHRQLEGAFHSFPGMTLYYDRRKGHYRDQGKPVAQIVSVIEVLQAILSIVLQRPDEARGRPRDYIKDNTNYASVFGEDVHSLTLYLKTTEVCRRVDAFLEAKQMEPIHRRNIYFYLCMYASCEMTSNGHADPGKIQQIDVSKLSDTVLETCHERVWKRYEGLAEKLKGPDGERDYDSVAKGPHLLRVVLSDLRRRFNKKKKKAIH